MKVLIAGKNFVSKLWKDESGQGMVEYGLILALVSVAVILLLTTLGGQLNVIFQAIIDALAP